MLPQYEQFDSTKPICKIQFSKYSTSIALTTLICFIFCILWSIIYYFDRSTATHCDVYNYLPSISAAIGNYEPQRTVWQIVICLQFLPRLLVIRMYIMYFDEHIRKNRRSMAYFACCLNAIENFALLGLTLWTSAEDYEVHKFCFILFIAMSELYMLISCLLFKYAKKTPNTNDLEEISLKYKRNLFLINVASFCLAGYFFVRHNSQCENGIYTMFALCEYIVVVTNIGFHMTAYWDFHQLSIAFDCKRGVFFTHQ